jgi:hypothetical protein
MELFKERKELSKCALENIVSPFHAMIASSLERTEFMNAAIKSSYSLAREICYRIDTRRLDAPDTLKLKKLANNLEKTIKAYNFSYDSFAQGAIFARNDLEFSNTKFIENDNISHSDADSIQRHCIASDASYELLNAILVIERQMNDVMKITSKSVSIARMLELKQRQ